MKLIGHSICYIYSRLRLSTLQSSLSFLRSMYSHSIEYISRCINWNRWSALQTHDDILIGRELNEGARETQEVESIKLFPSVSEKLLVPNHVHLPMLSFTLKFGCIIWVDNVDWPAQSVSSVSPSSIRSGEGLTSPVTRHHRFFTNYNLGLNKWKFFRPKQDSLLVGLSPPGHFHVDYLANF